MALPISFTKVTNWADAADPNNIPPGFKIIMASDLLRYENGIATLVAELNALGTTVSTNGTALGTLTTWKNSADTDITNLKKLRAVTTKTANYPIVLADSVIIGNNTGLTFTLPKAVDAGIGKTFTVKNKFNANLTVAVAASGGTIDGAATKTLAQWASADFISDGANWFVI
ncbi:hypothetical protein WILDE_34 [Arthrobacter phage Wilde]|uniref:Uncharacterized protein n=1 Tax=Arthrobacter phage Wilde TaxID=1772323 RepID=A0A0U4KBX6_9CAUD|nr:hypothetical protein WILDE_34 [Arthrobacter phage Wilde]